MMFETQMRVKLASAAVKATKAPRNVLSAVSHSYDAGAGCKHVKGWNAHLSMHTYARLKTQGIMV